MIPKWHFLGYEAPPNCTVLELKQKDLSNVTRGICLQEMGSENLRSTREMTHCEIATDLVGKCTRWSIWEWLFTVKPGVFGLAGGFANITGILLIIILTIMVICSHPIVRKSGHFEVFYQTLMLPCSSPKFFF